MKFRLLPLVVLLTLALIGIAPLAAQTPECEPGFRLFDHELPAGTAESLQSGVAGVNRISEVLKMQPEVDDPPHGVDPGRVTGRVQMEGVDFAYRQGVDVLHDISLTIEPGHSCCGRGWGASSCSTPSAS
jgi:ABC-type multidrug transport system fused ATPase/permease subunit